jgi:hypothetical protein
MLVTYSKTAKCVGKCQYPTIHNGVTVAIPFQYVTVLIEFKYNYTLVLGQDSSVGIATGYRLDGPGIESWGGRDFLRLSGPALGPTQPPVQLVPELVKCGRGMLMTIHSLLVPRSWKSTAITLPTLLATLGL